MQWKRTLEKSVSDILEGTRPHHGSSCTIDDSAVQPKKFEEELRRICLFSTRVCFTDTGLMSDPDRGFAYLRKETITQYLVTDWYWKK